jgi:hypothetical protein
VLQMPQLWGDERLFVSCYAKIEDCAWTAVLNRLDVREGSQGNSHPSVYSFRHSSPRCFSPLLLSAPFPDIRRVGSSACLPHFNSYFDVGAGVDVLGAGVTVLGAGVGVAGAGAGFTTAVLGDDVVGAAEL